MGSGASSIPMGDALDINQVKELVGEEYYQGNHLLLIIFHHYKFINNKS